jgi:hypothetical protein
MNETLVELGEKFPTDKNKKAHFYTRVYDKIFPDRYAVRNIMEIGLYHGGSAMLWHEYFPMAAINMVENNPMLIQAWEGNHAKKYPRVHVFPKSIDDYPWGIHKDYKFDLVIDDGSHEFKDQVDAFERGFQFVRPGGLWIIEDTQFKFEKGYGSNLYHWVWSRLMDLQFDGHGLGNFYKAREEIPTVGKLQRLIYGIQLFKSLVVFERAYD